jgi:16S rRNA processing protein RimM
MSRSPRSRQEKQDQPGSPQTGEPVYLTIGKLRRAHGIKGEIQMEVITEFPETIKAGKVVFVGDRKIEYTIATCRSASKFLLVSLEGFPTRESVDIFRNENVYAKNENLTPLPPGRLYQHEVIGMQVRNEAGDSLGEVIEILVTGANDVYIVRSEDGSELLLPAIKSVILSMDRDSKTMVVRPQQWA